MGEILPAKNRWKRRFYALSLVWVISTFLMSFSSVRALVATPLVIHDENAAGEVAYVMADGPASWERLRAASDLYHFKRIKRIIVLNEQESVGYDFVRGYNTARVERIIDYLKMYGVPEDAVSTIDPLGLSRFGSLNEARSFAVQEKDLVSIVLVTSPVHARRSELSFRRSVPASMRVTTYAARGGVASLSIEIHRPIWMEYAKYVVYCFVA